MIHPEFEYNETPEFWARIEDGKIDVYPGAKPTLWVDKHGVQHRLDVFSNEQLYTLGWRKVEHLGFKHKLDTELFEVKETEASIYEDVVFLRWVYDFLPNAKDVMLSRIDKESIQNVGILASPFAFEYWMTYQEAQNYVLDKDRKADWIDELKYPLLYASWRAEPDKANNVLEYALKFQAQWAVDCDRLARVRQARINRKSRIQREKDIHKAYKIYMEPWKV